MRFSFIFLFVVPALIAGSCAVVDGIQYGSTLTDLSKKGLDSIPESVYQDTSIRVLRLYGNSLDSLSFRIGNLINLEELYLGRNDLKTLPPEIGNLKKLRILTAQYNEIEFLPKEIGQMESLEQLILNQNELRTLPTTIGDLKRLQMLQVKYNFLDSLPSTIGGCQALQFIYLNRNNLFALPESLSEITGLKEIYLVGAGQMTDVPEDLCKLRMLELLEVDQFVQLPACFIVRQTGRLTVIRR
jgi:leucine-rich repeat protein SHOC2